MGLFSLPLSKYPEFVKWAVVRGARRAIECLLGGRVSRATRGHGSRKSRRRYDRILSRRRAAGLRIG